MSASSPVAGPSGAPAQETQEEVVPDPRGQIKVQYEIYVHKPKSHLMVLRYPNRDRNKPYNIKNQLKPLELRIKPETGYVELDVPVMLEMFDKSKGLEYGEALNKSRVLQQGGSYGLAGGLGGIVPGRGGREDRQGAGGDVDMQGLLNNFEHANNSGHVMNRITLGGRIQKPMEGDPVYYLGVFKMNQLHLTRISAFCNLVPNFKHLDAMLEKERTSHRVARDAENPPAETEARAINVAVKSTDEEENSSAGDINKILKKSMEEKWQALDWVDEEEDGAWSTYNKHLFCPEELQGEKLVAKLTSEQYLDLLSAPRVDPSRQGEKIMPARPLSISDDSDSDAEKS